MKNFNILILSASILLLNVPRGICLQCWTCSDIYSSALDCKHPIRVEDATGSIACAQIIFRFSDGRVIETRTVTSKSSSEHNDPSKNCDKLIPFNLQSPDGKIEECKICNENLCNLSIKAQSNIFLVTMGILLCFYKMFFSGVWKNSI